MIIKLINNSNSINNFNSTYFWLPVYLYHEPWQLSYSISFLEFLLYIFTCYVVIVNLRTFWKIQMFHRNFQILATPMFGLWIELIFGKLITMAYQLEILKIDFKNENFLAMWTDDEEKMLIVDSTENLELLIVGGFLEWHYMFSIIFGMVACVSERVIASMLIDNYETNTHLFPPAFLLLLTQLAAIPFSYSMLTLKIGVISANLIWISVCIFAISMFFIVKFLNESWLRRMEDPKRKVSFTVSQRFQVKENLRAIALGSRVVYAVLLCTVTIGIGIIASILDMVPPFLCHFAENCLFLNPLPICFVTMYSLPAWKNEFLKAFPSIKSGQNSRKRAVVSVEPVEDIQKKLDKETDVYFEQLNKSWI